MSWTEERNTEEPYDKRETAPVNSSDEDAVEDLLQGVLLDEVLGRPLLASSGLDAQERAAVLASSENNREKEAALRAQWSDREPDTVTRSFQAKYRPFKESDAGSPLRKDFGSGDFYGGKSYYRDADGFIGDMRSDDRSGFLPSSSFSPGFLADEVRGRAEPKTKTEKESYHGRQWSRADQWSSAARSWT